MPKDGFSCKAIQYKATLSLFTNINLKSMKETKECMQNLENKQEKQAGMMFNFVNSQRTSLAASHEVALLLAIGMKSF